MDNLNDIIAVGDLFKADSIDIRQWSLRKVVLAGVYLLHFDQNGRLKGRVDISGCTVRRMTENECGNSLCKFVFCLGNYLIFLLLFILLFSNLFSVSNTVTSRSIKRCILCATTELDFVRWINVIEDQIYRNQDVVYRFIRIKEEIICNGLVNRLSLVSSGSSTSVRLVLTNYPRILIIDDVTSVLLDQLIFNKGNNSDPSPTIQMVSKLQHTHHILLI